MRTARKQQGKRKHPANKSGKPAASLPEPPVCNHRQVVRLLADGAIACERTGQRKKFDEALEKVPGAVLALSALAGEPEHPLAREFSVPAIGLCEAAFTLADSADVFVRVFKEQNRDDLQQKALVVLQELQQAMSWMFRTVAMEARFLALHTTPTHSDLLVECLGNTLREMEELPKVLEQFEKIAGPDEFSQTDPDSFCFRLAEALVDLVRNFEEMCEKHPERFRYLARELPCWPALVTKHKAGYRKRFDRITGKGFLDLGAECPLDTSARAMYRLETPVCGLLWEEVFRDWLAVFASVRALRREAKEKNRPVDAEAEQKEIEQAVAHSGGTEAEREMFRAALALEELNKRSAPAWADKFVIPYLHFKYPDWNKLPALAKFMGKKGGDTKAEREVRRAVIAMARA